LKKYCLTLLLIYYLKKIRKNHCEKMMNQRKSSLPTVHRLKDLQARHSNLLGLFENNEIINIGAQAPAPSKDYCQLIVTADHVSVHILN
jgi:hypothetical protein